MYAASETTCLNLSIKEHKIVEPYCVNVRGKCVINDALYAVQRENCR